MHIIVDTNTIFSALLNSKGTLADIIFNYNLKKHKFYSCNYLDYELNYLENKILKISGLPRKDFLTLKSLLLAQIYIIDEHLIPASVIEKAQDLTADIDPDDSLFVALTLYTKGYLWTGDQKLITGLKKKRFNKVLTTTELKQIVF